MSTYPLYTLNPSEFPPLLTEITDSPKTLYYRGTLPSWNNNYLLAIVGSRKYSEYGKRVVQDLIHGLRGHPIVVVSGLALGIDALAHKAALKAGLVTIAVPGSGLDERVLYPRSHTRLARQILENSGMLLSEFEPTQKAAPWSFPQRNRIMAGMSHAVLVIEATEKSGTLITSKLATDYNRDVLTVPASIYSPSAKGPHMLLRLGATPITHPDDILEHFGLLTEESGQQELDLSTLTQDERKIIELLQIEPLPKDILLQKLNLPITHANILLSTLELKGLISESMGKIQIK